MSTRNGQRLMLIARCWKSLLWHHHRCFSLDDPLRINGLFELRPGSTAVSDVVVMG
jgi:hypothetical protein